MNRLLKGVNWLAAGILGWAGLVAWLQPVDFFGDPDLASPVVVGSLTIAFLLLINAMNGWMKRWSAKTYRRCVWGTLALIVFVQLIVAFCFVDASRADAFFVRTQAVALANGQHRWLRYFLIYPNNVNFTLLEAALIKGLTRIGLLPWVPLNVLRLFWIDTGLLSGLYLLKRYHRARPGALWLSWFWLISAPVYAYGLYAYNDALVMPLVLDCLALATWGLTKTRWRRWSGIGLSSVLLALGLVMKSNAVVFVIAAGLLILVLWQQHRIHWRTVLGWSVSLVAALGIMASLMGVWRQQSGYRQDPNASLPVTSWIAMSLNPAHSGQYVQKDFLAVSDQPTATAKQKQADNMIKTRLQQMGKTGLAVHFAKKMRVFFGTADFDSFKLTTQWMRVPAVYQTNQRRIQFWLVLLSQVIYLTVLIGAIRLLITGPLRPGSLFVALTIIGLTAFHVLFWEVEARYALPLLPGLLLLGCWGIAEQGPVTVAPRVRRVGRGLMTGLALFSLLSLWQSSQSVPITTTTVANQGNGSYVQNMTQRLQPAQQIARTIRTAGPSNRLGLSPAGKKRGFVNVTITAGDQVIASVDGTVKELRTLRYPTTNARKLTVTVTNIGDRALSYRVMRAPYDPQSGRLTRQNRNYLQYSVQFVHDPQTLSSGLFITTAVVLMFGGALELWRRLPVRA